MDEVFDASLNLNKVNMMQLSNKFQTYPIMIKERINQKPLNLTVQISKVAPEILEAERHSLPKKESQRAKRSKDLRQQLAAILQDQPSLVSNFLPRKIRDRETVTNLGNYTKKFMSSRLSQARILVGDNKPVPEDLDKLFEEYVQLVDNTSKLGQKKSDGQLSIKTRCNTSAKHGSVITFTQRNEGFCELRKQFNSGRGRIFVSQLQSSNQTQREFSNQPKWLTEKKVPDSYLNTQSQNLSVDPAGQFDFILTKQSLDPSESKPSDCFVLHNESTIEFQERPTTKIPYLMFEDVQVGVKQAFKTSQGFYSSSDRNIEQQPSIKAKLSLKMKTNLGFTPKQEVEKKLRNPLQFRTTILNNKQELAKHKSKRASSQLDFIQRQSSVHCENFNSVNKTHDQLRNKIVKAINLRTISKFESTNKNDMLSFQEALELEKMLKKLPEKEGEMLRRIIQMQEANGQHLAISNDLKIIFQQRLQIKEALQLVGVDQNWQTLATKTQFNRIHKLLALQYGFDMAKTRVHIMQFKTAEQLKRLNESTLKKRGMLGNKKDVPEHEHTPALCKQYGCDKSKRAYEKQMFDTDNFLEKQDVVEKYASIITKFLCQTTYANSPEPYIRKMYNNFKKQNPQEMETKYTLSFFQRQQIDGIIKKAKKDRLNKCIKRGQHSSDQSHKCAEIEEEVKEYKSQTLIGNMVRVSEQIDESSNKSESDSFGTDSDWEEFSLKNKSAWLGIIPHTLNQIRKSRRLQIKDSFDISLSAAVLIDKILNKAEYEEERKLMASLKNVIAQTDQHLKQIQHVIKQADGLPLNEDQQIELNRLNILFQLSLEQLSDSLDSVKKMHLNQDEKGMEMMQQNFQPTGPNLKQMSTSIFGLSRRPAGSVIVKKQTVMNKQEANSRLEDKLSQLEHFYKEKSLLQRQSRWQQRNKKL